MALNNTSIMKAAFLRATNDFQQRVPDPTRAGIAATSKFLFEPMNRKYLNEFMDILVNRIARVYVHGKNFENRLGAFKKERLAFGSTVEEIGLNWIKAHSYDFNDTAAILRVTEPQGKSAFHSVNRRDRYDITINEVDLRQAFVEEAGLNDLISKIMEIPTNSDEYDEYRIMLNLFAEHEKNHGIFKVHIDEVEDEKTAKAALREIRTIAGQMEFPSTLYNALDIDEVPTFVRPDECVMLTTPNFLAYLDVDALAQLFHVDRADVPYRVIVVDSLPIADARAIITSEDAFICHDTVYEIDSFYNPATLTTNYFLHHQGIYALSPFVPMVMLTVGAGTDADVVEAERGTFEFGVLDNETGAFTTTLPELAPGSSVQLMGYTPVKYAGGSNDYSKLDALDASFISVAVPQLSSEVQYSDTSTYVDRLGVLHISHDVLKTLDNSDVAQRAISVQAVENYTNPSGETSEPVIKTLRFTVKADAQIVEVSETARRAARKFFDGQAITDEKKPKQKNDKK